MRKLLLSSVAAAAVLSSSAFAAATIATDGTGQYLISGQYYAMPGYSTKLKLVNTDLNSSVIMRGVVRESVSSQEVDFTITLSPGDVWEADLYYENGKAMIKSTDDSNYVAAGSTLAASKIYNGFALAEQWNAAYPKVPRDFTKGYVEFYPIAQIDHGSTDKVNKVRPTGASVNGEIEGLYDAVDELAAAVDAATAEGMGFVAVSDDAVAGFTTIYAEAKDAAMMLPMLAIEGLDDTELGTEAGSAIVFGPDMEPGQDTIAAAYFKPDGVDNIREALTVKSVTAPFEAYGVDQDFKFAWWADYRRHKVDYSSECVQIRKFDLVVRDMEENRPGITTYGDVISPWKPEEETTSTTGCEMGYVGVRDMMVNYTTLGTNVYEKGMMKLSNFVDATSTDPQIVVNETGIVDNLAAVVTFMTATDVGDGKLSYNWIYPAVER